MTEAFVALGANLPGPSGGPADSLRAALDGLRRLAPGHLRASALYATPAYPAGSGPEFVNAVAALPWDGTAAELLAVLHGIEAALGRTRGRRWEARIVDLDLLAHGDAVLPDAETEAQWRGLPAETAMTVTPEALILPHPRLAERAFVLVPLAEIAPGWRHPVTGRSVAEMRDALPAEDLAAIRAL